MNNYTIEIYRSKEGRAFFTEWLDSLKDKTSALKIIRRIRRLELGNFGDSKSLGSNLYELRFFFGSGYRVYYTKEANKLVIIMLGGDKSTQSEDIKKAKELLEGMKKGI